VLADLAAFGDKLAAVKQYADIISVIDSTSSQTNILALHKRCRFQRGTEQRHPGNQARDFRK